jgi:signal transduction histidine kinase
MGLAIYRSIITSHGRTTQAETDEKHGTKILFKLPI